MVREPQVSALSPGQGLAEPGDIGAGRDLGGVDEQRGFPGDAHLRAGHGPAPACPWTSFSRGLARYPDAIPAVTMADRHLCSRPPSPAMGAEFTIFCMSATRMSWPRTAPMTGTTKRAHSRRWVLACRRDR